MKSTLLIIGNILFNRAFVIYRVLYIFYKSLHEFKQRNYIRQYVKTGMSVLDIGGNIGSTAIFFSKLVGSTGSVITFEPSKKNYRRLCETTRRYQNIQTVHAAVGDVSGKIKLFLSDELNVDHHTYGDESHRNYEVIDQYRLDDYFPKDTHIDFIKVDVQGYEYHVLNGAKRILQENPHIALMIEFWPSGLKAAGVNPEDLVALIIELGFLICRDDGTELKSDKLRILTSHHGTDYWDLLLVRK